MATIINLLTMVVYPVSDYQWTCVGGIFCFVLFLVVVLSIIFVRSIRRKQPAMSKCTELKKHFNISHICNLKQGYVCDERDLLNPQAVIISRDTRVGLLNNSIIHLV